jgi:hypothetical protein
MREGLAHGECCTRCMQVQVQAPASKGITAQQLTRSTRKRCDQLTPPDTYTVTNYRPALPGGVHGEGCTNAAVHRGPCGRRTGHADGCSTKQNYSSRVNSIKHTADSRWMTSLQNTLCGTTSSNDSPEPTHSTLGHTCRAARHRTHKLQAGWQLIREVVGSGGCHRAHVDPVHMHNNSS